MTSAGSSFFGRRGYLPAAAMLVLGTAAVASAQCAYDVTLVGYPCSSLVAPKAISNTGVIVGFAHPCGDPVTDRPFRWTEETGIQLLNLGPTILNARAYAISPDGKYIAGTGHLSDNYTERAFLWHDGVYQIIEPPAPYPSTRGYAVGEDGTVYGQLFDDFTGGPPMAWKDGAFLPIPQELADCDGEFTATRAGLVVGHFWGLAPLGAYATGFLWTPEGVQYMQPYRNDGWNGFPRAVNARREVSGRSSVLIGDGTNSGVYRPTIWHDGVPTDLGTPPPFDAAHVYGMNEVGQVVGSAYCQYTGPCDSDPAHKMQLWMNGTYYSLNSFLPPNWPGKVVDAWAINDSGVIAARGPYQSQAKMYIFKPVGSSPADITIDCRVDMKDLTLVLECWGPTAQSPVKRADVDGDGVVGPRDLAEVLGAWTPPPADSPSELPKEQRPRDRKQPGKPTAK